jgi:hypothetical protein
VFPRSRRDFLALLAFLGLGSCGTSTDEIDVARSGPGSRDGGQGSVNDAAEDRKNEDQNENTCACGAGATSGLRVTVRAGGYERACGATITARDGEYQERLVERETDAPGSCLYTGVSTRTGAYLLTMEHPRLELVTVGPVEVSGDCGCTVRQDLEIVSRGLCYPVRAWHFDPERACFDDEIPLPGMCLREIRPLDTTGTGNKACLISPEGEVFITFVGITQQVEGVGWTAGGPEGDPMMPACIAGLLAFGPVDWSPTIDPPSPRSPCGAPDAGP